MSENQYDSKTLEQQSAAIWAANNAFKPKDSSATYCIMLPPPNVTGTLHMGHGFQITLMDVLIRRARMQGLQTFWQGGTDHAGIATQMLVERDLLKKGKKRQDMSRRAFIDEVWEWKKQSGGQIEQQISRLGASLDTAENRFTMDDGMSLATKTAFIKLFDDQMIYKGKRLVNWDTQLKTAISDLEVINREQDGHLWHIRYPIVGSDQVLIVATTRPETCLGDLALAVHPDDDRYQSLIGKAVRVPLCNREVPIIADAYVDPNFGSGCVKITPSHDFNDYAVGERHQLGHLTILTEDGYLNDQVPQKYQGLERFKARAIMVQDLQDLDCIEKIEPHRLNIPYGDRSNTVIEPLLTDQWYVKTEALAKRAIEVAQNGALRFTPDNWKKTYLNWLENIEDWCISRQLWWGHRIPVWYDQQGQAFVGLDEADVREKYKLEPSIVLKQDEDVLDTWFSSALWPFATLGWPEQSQRLNDYYPTDTLVTGFDIIFFWVARMVMFGLYFMDDVPFRHVFVTGLIRDTHGAKMSKSKGNVLDPIDIADGISHSDLLEKRTQHFMQDHLIQSIKKATQHDFPEGIMAHGMDALRFTFCALANTGRDIKFDMNRATGYRNFCNKIYNASRFVLMQCEGQTLKNTPSSHPFDRWIRLRLNQTIQAVNTALDDYRFDLAANSCQRFFWNDYCDWYIELAKTRLNDPALSEEEKAQTRYHLLATLEESLRLLHPFIPYLTESLWQNIKDKLDLKEESIANAVYPRFNPELEDTAIETSIHQLQNIITAIRQLRSEMNIKPKQSIEIFLSHITDPDFAALALYEQALKHLAKVSRMANTNNETKPKHCANTSAAQIGIHVPLDGVIDTQSELERLDKTILKRTKEYDKIAKLLSNEKYLQNAPKDVIQKAQQQQEAIQYDIKNLEQAQQLMKKLSKN